MQSFSRRSAAQPLRDGQMPEIAALTRAICNRFHRSGQRPGLDEDEIRNESEREKLERNTVQAAEYTDAQAAWTAYRCIKVTLRPVNEGRINKGLLNLPGQ